MRSIHGILKRAVASGALVMTVAVAHAADAPPAGGGAGGGAVQKIGHGEINWTEQYIIATGSAAPAPNSANVAVARLGAERAAKMDAFRNILEVIKGAQVTAKSTGADEMSNGTIKSKVEGLVKNFKVMDTKYYSDGSVDVIVRVELKGELSDALVPDTKPVAVPEKGAAKNTGLVINAKGLQAVPAMAPRVVDEAGNEVYGVSMVTEQAAKDNGIAGYVKDVDAAQQHNRVKGTPLTVRAIRLASPGKSDLVISNADAEKLRDPNGNMSYLAQGKVIIVID